MSQKLTTVRDRTQGNLTSTLKNLYGSSGSVYKIPGTRIEGGVIVPFALTACIPESAIREFAAKKPFIVHVDDGSVKHLIAYLGD